VELANFFHARFLLGIFFNSEDGDDIFLRNVGYVSTDSLQDRTVHSNTRSIGNWVDLVAGSLGVEGRYLNPSHLAISFLFGHSGMG
jgi:hypothetical protein